MAYLTVRVKGIEGHHKQKLIDDRLVLGRSSKCDIQIEDVDGVSREHCVFTQEDGQWFVEDMGTTNGTKVNKDKIEGKTLLEERDIVKVSKVRMTVHVDSESQRMRSQAAPEHEVGEFDPQEAISCPSCDTWVSVAHRLPGEHFACPRCKTQISVPQLVQV
ncbi:MAG: FHA domain-containing protein [Planctomycetes bacterium]|nr:FHA domain-containing protein [Planctomycetota bacterium]